LCNYSRLRSKTIQAPNQGAGDIQLGNPARARRTIEGFEG
jgi:hypothetical protein